MLQDDTTVRNADAMAELVAMLRAVVVEEGLTIFEHSPEEIGIAVMENHTAILAALSPADGATGVDRYRHVARGTEYDLIGTAELQDAAGNGVEEGALLAIYRGDDGKLWARRHKEFGDGRFERLAALTPTETGEQGK